MVGREGDEDLHSVCRRLLPTICALLPRPPSFVSTVILNNQVSTSLSVPKWKHYGAISHRRSSQ